MTGGYGPHPQRLIRTPVQGGYPQYHLIFSPPQEGFSPGPLTPRFKRFPATRILPLPFVCFLCGTWHIAFLQKHCQWEEFINCMVVTQTKRKQYCSIITWLMSRLLLICQGLQSHLLDCRLKTQTKREQYCCHIEDSFDSIITWLGLCYSSSKCSLDCMLMMQTCSQARNDIVRNSVICLLSRHSFCKCFKATHQTVCFGCKLILPLL